ncbi:GNAT family N-acetyltransferase [Pelagibacterium luteolum]|uniref:Protein N-acetyltransferase, RimJ/RimL family n=1 Tax=Pelagibacterium luteolum TaxID=440168 RepID=A0A1G7WGP1_9HYPH|nr:GNAT family N-acetyltransferase [Pelagibacterium luteolum]SDG71068.1 Protein N-acetyltransferase, RimJ/RimL family [Pelagibacterium luteolum]
MLKVGQLETERLIVRPFTPADEPGLVAMFADPRVAHFVGEGTALSPEDAALWVANSCDNIDRFGYATGAVILCETGEMIGWAGIARPPDDAEEVIYGLAHAYWGRGYGSELLRGLVGFWCQRHPDKPMRATVDPLNLASVHMLTAQGFVLNQASYEGDDCDLYIRPAEVS